MALALSARSFRIAVALLTAVLSSMLGVTLWHFGRTPTDENLFTPPPSSVMLWDRDHGGPAQADDGLRRGDLVTEIDDHHIVTVKVFQTVVAAAEGPVVVKVVRQAPGLPTVVRTDAERLRRWSVRDVLPTAYVIQVTDGGASARAGMRVGDLILRINGRPFVNVVEAEAILRSGIVGRSTDYDIMRAGVPMTLRVTLASFGLRLSVIVFVIGGLTVLALGAFLGLARPSITAARVTSLSFLMLGIAVCLLPLRRRFDTGALVFLRDVTVTAATWLGLAALLHSSLYFPRLRPSLLARRWIVTGAYGSAATLCLATLVLGDPRLTTLALAIAAGGLVSVQWLGADELAQDARRTGRLLILLTVATLAIGLMGVAGVFRQPLGPGPDPGYTGLLLPAIPLGYLWAIGRYGLLDLNLRPRRHIQYSVASAVWTLLPLLVLGWVVLALTRLSLPIPNVTMAESSVEVLRSPMETGQRASVEKILLMIAAIAAAFTLRSVARRGQQWLANRFYRAEHDYRLASREVSAIVTSYPDLDGLAMGLVETVVKLLQVRRAGAIFFHQPRTYCSCKGHGFSDAEWDRLSGASEDILSSVQGAKKEIATEYAPQRLRELLASVRTEYVVPLRAHDKLVGALLVGEKLAEDVFRKDDFEFLAALASQIAPAIDNAFLYSELARQERLRHELELARRIQMESLPQFTPRIEGLDIAAVSMPAFEVGGDYFDYLDGDARKLTIMVGDVSGKGTSAALYMSKLQGIVRSLHIFDLSPRELFVRTNDLLCRDLERHSFVTAIGAFFDTAARQMTLARAGHLPLYHYSGATRSIARLLPRGLGFGFSADVIFERQLQEQVVTYGDGDVFLFVTDGITECLGPEGDDFGEERLMTVLQREAGGSAREIRDRISADIRTFAGTQEQFDDQTIVVVKAV